MLTARVSHFRLPRAVSTTLIAHLRTTSCSGQSFVNQRHDENRSGNSHTRSRSQKIAVGCALALGSLFGYTLYRNRGRVFLNMNVSANSESSKKSYRTITVDELMKHNNEKEGVWVSYQNLVYDVSEFVALHPGGRDKILLAAGGPLEPFWDAFPVHKTPDVREMLDEYQIGEVRGASELSKLAEICKAKESQARAQQQYAYEPERSDQLRVVNERPFNAETPESSLARDYFTPNSLFFVRNHLGVPKIDIDSYKLVIEVDSSLHDSLAAKQKSESVANPPKQDNGTIEIASIDYESLQREFPAREMAVALMCSGNRRSELHTVEPVKGLMWQIGAASNARWTGVFLADAIERLTGYSLDQLEASGVRHVQFVGADRDVSSNTQYAASIPLSLLRSRRNGVLLAYLMNGEVLPADHGYPIRVLVPGVTGARSVKWVTRVRLSASEADSVWQRNDYRVLPFWMTFERNNLDFTVAPPIYDTPVTSAISEPSAGAKVQAKAVSGDSNKWTVPVRGFALSGGGHSIVRVEVSADGGRTWQSANLISDKSATFGQEPDFAWAQWHCDVAFSGDQLGADGRLELVCRATDSSYNVQPENPRTVWNVRGLLNNAQHHRVLFVTK